MFVRTVIRRWWLLVPGLAGGADWVLGLVRRWLPAYEPPVSGDIGVALLFAGGLVIASFLAFHDQRVEKITLMARLDERLTTFQIKAQLDEFMKLGNEILSGATQTADDAALDDLTTQVVGWATAVRDYLDMEGTNRAGLFLGDVVPFQQFAGSGFEQWSKLTNYLRRRLFQLGEIVKGYQSSIRAAISSQVQT